jgi:hypothetical protein
MDFIGQNTSRRSGGNGLAQRFSELMKRILNWLLSIETFMWIVEVILFVVVAGALLVVGEAITWWGVLGLLSAVILLLLLVWANVRSWQEHK